MEIIKSVSVTNLLRQRESIKERLSQADRLWAEAQEIYDASGVGKFGNLEDVRFEALGAPNFHVSRIGLQPSGAEVLKGFDATAWKHLMRESGMQTFMSSMDIDEWEATIAAKTTPELTLDNIRATFSELGDKRETMLERGVLAVFRSLSWDYKTNLPVKFGAKIIVSIANPACSIDAQRARLVDDLIRFMHVADSQPQPDHRSNFSARAAFKSPRAAEEFVSDYASIKAFANGNAHIKFKRPDLVDKLNAILAARFPDALPAPR